MDRLLIITYPEMALGFGMAGADVMEIERGKESLELIERVIDEDRYSLIALEEALLDRIPEGLERRLRKRGRPALIPIRSPERWGKGGPKEPYIAKMLRKTIGYHIKIKR